MHMMWFTERAYHYVPEEEVLKRRSFFGVPNTFCDAAKGGEWLYGGIAADAGHRSRGVNAFAM